MSAKTKTVKVPTEMAPLFENAESLFRAYFDELELRPENADITVAGARYLLLRTDSFSLELQQELRTTFGEVGARQIRYRLAKALGARDARHYHERLDVDDPKMRIALGPVHFAFVGWAQVEMLPESRPVSDENALLVYVHHRSFEADAYLANDMRSTEPVCHMNAGYSAGWVQQSLGVELDSMELTCRARGDAQCGFVMAPPTKLREECERWRGRFDAPAD